MSKRNIIKYFLLIVIAICTVNYAFAGSCIMVSPNDITKVVCSNNNVIGYHILSTLTNEKRSVIINSISDGEADLTLELKNKKCNYKAVVRNGRLEIKGDKYIKILPIDLPPEVAPVEDSK